MGISITKKTSTQNTTYSPGRKHLYIVEHYTAGTTSKPGSAANTASWFANPAAQASADFIVDDANIVQFNPDLDNRYCWAVGGNSYGNKGGSLYGVAKNANVISIEICSTNRTGKVTNANDANWYFTDAVLDRAVELTKYLMEKYGIDAGHVIRHYDVNGKPCPGIIGWNAETRDESKWKAFKARLTGSSGSSTAGLTKIMGTAAASAAQMQAYIKSVNSKVAQSVIDMIPLYLSEGAAEGVRGDVAFAQSCLETGNFGFAGSAVTLDQNNFCGMGVTSNGMKGNSFTSPQIGIRAQIQHLKAYASTAALKNAVVDPRFQYVTRGCAEYVEWLGQKENPGGKGWAAGAGYGEKILTILKKITGSAGGSSSGGTSGSNASFPAVPFTVKVIVSDLNFRSEPSMSGAVKGQTGKGTFTITQVKNGWGKLKSGAGWIYLENPSYVTIGKTASGSAAAPKVPYMVRVKINDLRIRKGAGTDTGWTGKYTGAGTFTIVEEKSGKGSDKGWGRLKSGAGWISLDYCEKV